MTPIHMAMLDIATILDTLAIVLDVSHVVTNLAKALSSPLSQKSICLHVGAATLDLSSSFPRLPAQPHYMSWNGSWGPILILLFHIIKVGLLQ